MKRVCYHIFYPANAPKSAQRLIDYCKQAVGSEMMGIYFHKFLENIFKIVDEINAMGKIHLDVSNHKSPGSMSSEEQITISSPRKWGPEDIVRLNFVIVDAKWLCNQSGQLRKYGFTGWDKEMYDWNTTEDILQRMIGDIKSGGKVDIIVDRYVKFGTPELRQEFLDRLKKMINRMP